MSVLEDGAQVGTILVGLSAVTAGYVWIRGQLRDWREAKAARSYRFWNGYVIQGGVFTAFVRLVPNPADSPPERVTFDVINSNGTPNEQMAHDLRQFIESDGMISRSRQSTSKPSWMICVAIASAWVSRATPSPRARRS
jgi:hypothetical protein